MVHSMTGYGKSTGQFQAKKFTVEVRSLNSKGMDLNVRMASIYREKELELRKFVGKEVERGKCEMNIFFEQSSEEKSPIINETLLKAYATKLKDIYMASPQASEPDFFALALRMPEVLQVEREELNPEEWEYVMELVKQALENFRQFRLQEGASLQADFETRLGNIANGLAAVEVLAVEKKEEVRTRLTNALNEAKEKMAVDANRFEQELIYYLEKLDISEEQVRLKNHLDYFKQTMTASQNSGRKLGFIAQEIGREINTIGSKCNHAAIQKHVVEMKDELEKVKEQVLNVL